MSTLQCMAIEMVGRIMTDEMAGDIETIGRELRIDRDQAIEQRRRYIEFGAGINSMFLANIVSTAREMEHTEKFTPSEAEIYVRAGELAVEAIDTAYRRPGWEDHPDPYKARLEAALDHIHGAAGGE
jgi:hypothetical protein